jgi:hypothetical protein
MGNSLLAALSRGADLAKAANQVASLAKIPPEIRPAFCEDLMRHVRAARRAGLHWKRPARLAWLRPIAERAAALAENLRNGLGVDARLTIQERRQAIEGRLKVVETLIERGARDAGHGMHIQALLGALDALAEPPLPALQHPKTPPKRGRPETPLLPESAPEIFVAELRSLILVHGGKKLGFSEYNGKRAGKLVQALALLGPHLGNGFVESLSPGTLRRLSASKLGFLHTRIRGHCRGIFLAISNAEIVSRRITLSKMSPAVSTAATEPGYPANIDPVLNVNRASEYTGLSVSSLNKLRCFGSGPIFVKYSRRIGYRRSDLDAWINAKRVSNTSRYAAA